MCTMIVRDWIEQFDAFCEPADNWSIQHISPGSYKCSHICGLNILYNNYCKWGKERTDAFVQVTEKHTKVRIFLDDRQTTKLNKLVRLIRCLDANKEYKNE